MTPANDDNLIWIDLEMTGLDTDNDSILEIATIVTDKDLNVLAEGPVFAISHADARLQQMDAWNRNQHMRSGLWGRSVESDTTPEQAEEATIAFLRQWVPPGKSPMCGNYFHYRNLDVSTLKELSRRWSPEIARGFAKDSAHTALSDIRDSIDELRYYRRFLGALGGQQPG
jgi:oligoribonuclease